MKLQAEGIPAKLESLMLATFAAGQMDCAWVRLLKIRKIKTKCRVKALLIARIFSVKSFMF